MDPVSEKPLYVILADAILLLHAAFIAFIVLGLFLIYVGKLRSWLWASWFCSPGWVFVLVYTLFGLLVLASLFVVHPLDFSSTPNRHGHLFLASKRRVRNGPCQEVVPKNIWYCYLVFFGTIMGPPSSSLTSTAPYRLRRTCC